MSALDEVLQTVQRFPNGFRVELNRQQQVPVSDQLVNSIESVSVSAAACGKASDPLQQSSAVTDNTNAWTSVIRTHLKWQCGSRIVQ